MTTLFNVLHLPMPFIGLRLAQYLLIASIVSQSAFAAADSCSVSESTGFSAEFSYQAKTVMTDIDSNLVQNNAGDDCADHNGECCAACANVMFASVTLPAIAKSAEQLMIHFKRARLDAPYYSLLRPPKINVFA